MLRQYKTHIQIITNVFNQKAEDQRDPTWVSEKIGFMFDKDQYTRIYWDSLSFANQEEKDAFRQEFAPIVQELDRQNTKDLKSLTDIWGWFTFSKFGKQTAYHAWLLAQHADHDLDFQKYVLKEIEKLYPKGEAYRENYAYLYDRVATKTPPYKQKYGTQLMTQNGVVQPCPLEDPDNVDTYRKEMEMLPLQLYIQSTINRNKR